MTMLQSIIKRMAPVVLTVLLVLGVSTAAATAATVDVKMGTDTFTMAFEPTQVTVAPGDTIHFMSNHMGPHNVVFESEPLASVSHGSLEMDGASFDVTIPADTPAGDYTYYCEPHRGANMVGKVTVS